MIDFRSKYTSIFPADAKGTIAWFDVANYATASVQIFTDVAWSGSPVVEVVVANVKKAETATLLSSVLGVTASTLELSTNGGIITAIDCGGLAFRYVGLRVKTAGTSGDRIDVYFAAKSDGQAGSITTEPPDIDRGLGV